MSNTARLLRTARAEVSPLIPNLAPHLNQDAHALLRPLQDVYVQHGHDPLEVGWKDWNKTERHTIAAFLIKEMSDDLVEGEAHDAHFKYFPEPKAAEMHKPSIFAKKLRGVQKEAAKVVEWRYSAGYDEAHTWWPQAARRYRKLAMERHLARDEPLMSIPFEGTFLRFGLRSHGLSSAVKAHTLIINARASAYTPKEKLKAAHDLAPSILRFAGVNLEEFFANMGIFSTMVDDTKRTVLQNDGTYVFNERIPQIGRIPHTRTTTLKCPAHMMHTGEDATSLRRLFHASLNAAYDYGVYQTKTKSAKLRLFARK